MPKANRYLSKTEALEKARRYCAYQERCQDEVRNKLLEWGQKGNTIEDIIAQLISENFINEERFAKAYARGKFRMKHWGINKIKLGLQQKNISASCIKIALEEIDSKEVLTTVKSLIEKKSKLIKDKNEQLRKKKIAEYVIRKGYSPAMVWDVLQSED